MIRTAWNALQWMRQSRLWPSWIASTRERLANLRRYFSVSLWLVMRRGRRKRTFLPNMETLEVRMVPTTYTVNTTSDAVSHSGVSLRDAITAVNGDSFGSDIINFSGISGQTITLTQGQLELSAASLSSITIEGASAITISGNSSSRIFQVDSGVNAVLTGLTVEDGSESYGGGIYNEGTLTVSGSTLSGNGGTNGGGIFNYAGASLTVSDSTFS
jgi:hypothetical protein